LLVTGRQYFVQYIKWDLKKKFRNLQDPEGLSD
jgi:hypothetical protein